MGWGEKGMGGRFLIFLSLKGKRATSSKHRSVRFILADFFSFSFLFFSFLLLHYYTHTRTLEGV